MARLLADEQADGSEIPGLAGGVVEARTAVEDPELRDPGEEEVEARIPRLREVTVLEALPGGETVPRLPVLLEAGVAPRLPAGVVDVFLEEARDPLVVAVV